MQRARKHCDVNAYDLLQTLDNFVPARASLLSPFKIRLQFRPIHSFTADWVPCRELGDRQTVRQGCWLVARLGSQVLHKGQEPDMTRFVVVCLGTGPAVLACPVNEIRREHPELLQVRSVDLSWGGG